MAAKGSKTKQAIVEKLAVIAADGVQDNEKAEVTELVAELDTLGAVEEIVVADVSGTVACADVQRALLVDSVKTSEGYVVPQEVADIIAAKALNSKDVYVSAVNVPYVATIKYWYWKGHTNRQVVVA